MNKTILLSVQIDGVTTKDLPEIEELIEEALKNFTRKQVTFNVIDSLGPPLPIRQNGN